MRGGIQANSKPSENKQRASNEESYPGTKEREKETEDGREEKKRKKERKKDRGETSATTRSSRST